MAYYKVSVAEILKDKPVNTKLYSPLFGDVYFSHVEDSIINVEHHAGVSKFFNSGRYYNFDESEPLLFPSMEMRDRSKFSWKKGDVLVCKDVNSHIIFEKFNDDTYTTFTGKLYYQATRAGYSYTHTRNLAMTQDFDIEEGDAVQTYIKTIEEKLGGKLNRETLEVEKAQHEFKNGDIAFADYGNRQDVFIVSDKTDLYEGYSSFISLDLRGLTLSMGYRTCFFKKNLCELRLATEEEKQQLFDALAKEGKHWDAEKEMIVDLKPKVEFKPFDKVVVRDKEDLVWFADLFSHIDKENNRFACVGNFWNVCLPYNEETAKLIGTTNNVEG
jgi:hypothetical protein